MLTCLKLGVAIHHGALPTPYRREVERLLRRGVLKITVSSPTLAQGLNLSATALIFHGLYRNRQLIDVSEFRNVIGRAGRAFVDVEGLVLYPMFDKIENKKRNWRQLINDTGGKEMESGLLLLVQYLLSRMFRKHKHENASDLIAYVMNAGAWDFPTLDDESPEESLQQAARWQSYITMLDTALLGLIGEADIPDDEIEIRLDEILQSSLWKRRLVKREEHIQSILRAGLVERTKYVWANTTAVQRRAYFLAGVGLSTGQTLDAQAAVLNTHLCNANIYISNNHPAEAIESLTAFAEILFTIPPFIPKSLPDNWKGLLAGWLNGVTISSLVGTADPETLQFIEEALIYKLPWGMEAVRVRGLAHNDKVFENFTLSDYDLSYAVSAVETGTLNVSAAILMKAGFSSRSGAIRAVAEADGIFLTLRDMRAWISSPSVVLRTITGVWPTPETGPIWTNFTDSFKTGAREKWVHHNATFHARWHEGFDPLPGQAVRLENAGDRVNVLLPNFAHVGFIHGTMKPFETAIFRANIAPDNRKIDVTYVGPGQVPPWTDE